MLTLAIPEREMWDEVNSSFIRNPALVLHMEHSLSSISKWESIHKKSFLNTREKTRDEQMSYYQCMIMDENVPDDISYAFTNDEINTINSYIEDSHTATFFKDDNKKAVSRKIITSEVIYYWMVIQQIPFECDKWNFNRLMTLIRVCGEEQKEHPKMNMHDRYAQNNALNKARRAKYHK